jgi:hypothetical protein
MPVALPHGAKTEEECQHFIIFSTFVSCAIANSSADEINSRWLTQAEFLSPPPSTTYRRRLVCIYYIVSGN